MALETKTLDDLASLQAAPRPRRPMRRPFTSQKLDKLGRAYATGKRKNAVARVWIKPGNGKITVNAKDYRQYFARPVLQMLLQQPLQAANRTDQYDIIATVIGRRSVRSGRRRASRHLQGAHPLTSPSCAAC